MTLLKDKKIRKTNGVGFTVTDGWYLGIGFGLAMTIAVPLILLFIGCIVGLILLILGVLY